MYILCNTNQDYLFDANADSFLISEPEEDFPM